jgi:hypothetical protein
MNCEKVEKFLNARQFKVKEQQIIVEKMWIMWKKY